MDTRDKNNELKLYLRTKFRKTSELHSRRGENYLFDNHKLHTILINNYFSCERFERKSSKSYL